MSKQNPSYVITTIILLLVTFSTCEAQWKTYAKVSSTDERGKKMVTLVQTNEDSVRLCWDNHILTYSQEDFAELDETQAKIGQEITFNFLFDSPVPVKSIMVYYLDQTLQGVLVQYRVNYHLADKQYNAITTITANDQHDNKVYSASFDMKNLVQFISAGRAKWGTSRYH